MNILSFWNKNIAKMYHLATKYSDLKDTSQKADLERDHALPRSCHINIKGGAKGLDWCYIGPEWRKVAEVG